MNRFFRNLVLATLAVLLLVSFYNVRHKNSGGGYFPRLGSPAPSDESLASRLKSAEAGLAKNPDDLKALVDKGVVYFQMGPDHYADSLNSLNAAWRSGAFDTRIFYYSGVLYENLSLFEESERQYERFLKHEPQDREIQLRLARLLFRMGRWKDSVVYYEKLLAHNPKDLTCLINLGFAHQKQYEADKDKVKSGQLKKDQIQAVQAEGQASLDQAVSYLERASQIEPDLPQGVYLSLSKLYFDKGELEKSVSAGESELKGNAGDKETLQVLAQGYEKLDQKEKTLEILLRLQEGDPENRSYRQKIKTLRTKLAKK